MGPYYMLASATMACGKYELQLLWPVVSIRFSYFDLC